jgi:Beta-1,3-glucanase
MKIHYSLLTIFVGFTLSLPAQIPILAPSKAPKFFPLQIKNNAAASDKRAKTFILFTGKTIEDRPKNCALTFKRSNGVYIGQLVPIAANSDATNFTILLDTMQRSKKSNTVLLMIPTLQSGRAMVSINNPLCMTTVHDDAGFAFQEPDISNPDDPSFNYLFDKFEYTYDTTGTFFINPTAVDFFAIPMHLNTLNGNKHSGAPIGASRSALLRTISNKLTTGDKTKDKSWKKCTVTDPSGKNILRIAAPSVAPGFNLKYLSDPAGFNYLNSLISYYKKDTIVIDCQELTAKTMEVFERYNKTFQQDPGAYYFTGTIDRSNKFIFTNQPADSTGAPMTVAFDMNNVTSQNMFAPGSGELSTPNKTVRSIIVKFLTSAFSVGLLPAVNRDTFSKAWFPERSNSFYQLNPLNPPQAISGGPWYSLYSEAIHAALGPSMYAFAYDDVLGQDGTLVTNNKDTVRITIGDLGLLTIPTQNCRLPVQTIGASTITVDSMLCKNNKCTISANWTVPAGQPANAQYFLMFGPGDFKVSTDSIVANQLAQGALQPFSATSATLCFNQDEWLNIGKTGTDIKIQVMTCGGPKSPCPTKSNISAWVNSQGSQFVGQTKQGKDVKGCLPQRRR